MRRTSGVTAGVHFESLQQRLLLASDPLVAIGNVTSSSVTLGWEAIPNASEIRVYLAAEPSQIPGDDLPGQILVGTIPGDAISYTVTNLAAEVDVFFRVEADVMGEEVGSNIHARTVGGPNSGTDNRMNELDTPLRSVHGYGPNILQLVLAEFEIDASTQATAWDNDGLVWQYGEWSITRADGTPIEVVEVFRQTVPSGVWKMDLTTDDPNVPDYGSTRVVDADHHIVLVLDEDIGSREILNIEGPRGLQFILPFSDQYLETTVIQLNQVGYNPNATERYAYVSGWMGDGGGLDLSNFSTIANVLIQPPDALAPRTVAVGNLPITQRSAFDSYSGGPVNEIDLSVVPAAEGVRYRVQIPGVGVSWATAVSEEAAFKAYYTILRGLYFQRWGDELGEEYTEWVRGTSHVTRKGDPNLGENPNQTYPVVYKSDIPWEGGTQFFPRNTPRTDPIEIRGGHHDAADHDLRSYHTVIPQLLMRAYELNVSAHTDGQLHIPESGNGIPDILDEALWNIQSWEALQEPNGGVRAGVESYGHPSHGYRTEDRAPYWTYGVDLWTTAKAAGIFAQAARLIQPFDAVRSAELQQRAINAYNYVKSNGGNIRWRLYGASELYALTGQAVYKNDFESYWNTIGGASPGAFQGMTTNQGQTATHMPDHVLGYLTADGANSSMVSVARTQTQNRAASAISDLYGNHAHRTPGSSSGWGASTSLGREMDDVYARLQLGNLTSQQEQAYFNALSLSADFILGGNPMGMSWITGLGSRYPRAITHHDAQAFIKDGLGLMPGIPVYGVVQAISPNSGTAAQYPARTFYPAPSELPAYRRYGDSWTMIATSEFTVSEMSAPHAELFAALLPEGLTAPDSYKPYQSEHRNTLTAFGNKAPVVDAGEDRVVNLVGSSAVVNLVGSVSDDGVTPIVATQWRLARGPAGVTFGDASALETTATFTRSGEYVLHLVADDGETLSFDIVRVIVNSTAATAPVVDAGLGYHVALPENQVSLNGTVSGGGTSTTWWSVDSTPAGGRVIFEDASAINTTATFNLPGTYTLRLHADNGTHHTSDLVRFVVRPEGSLVWTSANVADSKTLALYHFDETAGTRADNAQGASNRDLIMGDSSVWQPTNAWGGDGGHISARQVGGSTSLSIPTDWSNGMTLSFWMRANIDPGGTPPVKLQGQQSWSNEMGLMWIYANLESTAIARDTYAYLKNLALQDPSRTLTFEELTDGQWHHYAIVYMGDESGMARLYVDNMLQEVNASGATEWPATSTSIADLGRLIINRFNGEIDELLLQNEALTDFSNGHDASKNFAPWVYTGKDRVIDAFSTELKAWVTDDGFTPTLNTTWTKVSGPGEVTFGNPSSPNTTVSFSAAGTYVLRLTADDGELTGYDEVRIIIANAPPSVNAGADQSITLPNVAQLNGTVSDDGKPGLLTTLWSKVSGPGTVTFGDPTAVDTTAEFSQPGTYVLRLTADDGDKVRHDDVTIVVKQAWVPTGTYATNFSINKSADFQYAQIGTFGSNSTSPHVTANWNAGHLAVDTRYDLQYSVALRVSDDGDGLADNNNGYYTGDVAAELHWIYNDGDSSNIKTALSVRQSGNSGSNNYPLYYAMIADSTLTIYKRSGFNSQVALASQSFPISGGLSTYTLKLSAEQNGSNVDLSATLLKNGAPLASVNAIDTSSVITAGYIGFAMGSGDNNWRGARIIGFAVNPEAVDNVAPAVDAGADQQITLPNEAILSGTVSDDGNPNPPGAVSVLWSKVFGPGTVTFADATALTTTVAFSEPGEYVLRLTANDGAIEVYDEVTIIVSAAPSGGADYRTDFTSDISSDFAYAQIGNFGSNIGPHVTADWSGGNLAILTRYNLQHTLALITSEDGDGVNDNNDGYYTGDVTAELSWQYTDGDSSNVRTALSVRQSGSSGANNYPVYYALVENDTLTIYKRTGYSVQTALATQSFGTVGGSSTYTLQLSAVDAGNNVELSATLLQDGQVVASANATDTSNVIQAGYIGFGIGSSDTIWRGGKITGFAVNPTSAQVPAQMVGQYTFYGMAEDGVTPRIAPDKQALRPGQTASYANYTNYHLGLVGVAIDVAGLPLPTDISASDFVFKVGRGADTSQWTAPPEPTITVLPGEGEAGADRILLQWADGAIVNQWLEVTMLTTQRTGLAQNEVFYFGNVPGETGNLAGNTAVSNADLQLISANRSAPGVIVGLDNRFDINRDGKVTNADIQLAQMYRTAPGEVIELFTAAEL